MSEVSNMNSSFEFWLVGVMITVVSVVGILGNIICILMFQYKRLNMNQTFASLLKWLAVIDSFFLVSVYFLFSCNLISVLLLKLIHFSLIPVYVLPSIFPTSSVLPLQDMDIPLHFTYTATIHKHFTYW